MPPVGQAGQGIRVAQSGHFLGFDLQQIFIFQSIPVFLVPAYSNQNQVYRKQTYHDGERRIQSVHKKGCRCRHQHGKVKKNGKPSVGNECDHAARGQTAYTHVHHQLCHMLIVQDFNVGQHASPDQSGDDDTDVKNPPVDDFVRFSHLPGDHQVDQPENANAQVGEKKDQGSK